MYLIAVALLGLLVVLMVFKVWQKPISEKQHHETLENFKKSLAQLGDLLKEAVPTKRLDQTYIEKVIPTFLECDALLDQVFEGLYWREYKNFNGLWDKESRKSHVIARLLGDGKISQAELANLMDQKTAAILLEFPAVYKQLRENIEEYIGKIPHYHKTMIAFVESIMSTAK